VCLWEHVHVDDNVFLGPNAVLTNDLTPRSRSSDWVPVQTWIEEGVSVGANATIVCGIRLGRRCLVGAGAVVIRDVRPHELVYGNPAQSRGWVCFCARPLRPDIISITTCNGCGRKYKIEETGIQEVT
jgi:acetyltransferase-like isoleucine patch superfamily enzyme